MDSELTREEKLLKITTKEELDVLVDSIVDEFINSRKNYLFWRNLGITDKEYSENQEL